jgi:tripartite-type tricarboxylate transporter receptor subunit TctC
MNTEMPSARRPRTLALRLVEVLGERIRDGAWPEIKPVTLLVPFPPGGSTDT